MMNSLIGGEPSTLSTGLLLLIGFGLGVEVGVKGARFITVGPRVVCFNTGPVLTAIGNDESFFCIVIGLVALPR